MRTIFVVFIVALLFVSAAYCEQQYNANEGRWETVPDGSNWSSQYNPHTRDWSLQPNDAQVEYNPQNRSWDWDSGHNPKSDD